MAKMNGCNSDMPKGPIGKNSTRINPNSFARNNMSKGGVNAHAGGSDTWDTKPKLSAGDNGLGKHRHDKR